MRGAPISNSILKSVIISVILLSFVCVECQLEICNAISTNCNEDRFTVGSKRMTFIHKEENWYEAKRKCEQIGMKLLTLATAMENVELRIYLNDRVFGKQPINDAIHWYLWTSGSTDNRERTWKWATTGQNFTYTSWGEGEPNGFNENCMELRLISARDVVWNDNSCLVKKRFICETYDFGFGTVKK